LEVFNGKTMSVRVVIPNGKLLIFYLSYSIAIIIVIIHEIGTLRYNKPLSVADTCNQSKIYF